MKQYRYIGKDGEFDYAQYRRVQVKANKKKIEWQWTTDDAIKFLAKNIVRILGEPPKYGILPRHQARSRTEIFRGTPPRLRDDRDRDIGDCEAVPYDD